jgi:hypothetical protein
MIFGKCPNCDAHAAHKMPREASVFSKTECTFCKKPYWMYYDRQYSRAYTEEDFNKIYVINEETKNITRRDSKLYYLPEQES